MAAGPQLGRQALQRELDPHAGRRRLPALALAAALLGGGLGLAAHATKLGLRVAVDASPEPVTNGLVNTAELGVLATISYLIWHHPIIALIVAVLLLILTALLVRMVWRALRNLLRGNWRSFFPLSKPHPAEHAPPTK